ncbi:MAG: phosphate/phosphite/phosphonate ABC transporter substrate-binding protein [Deltaproteobacteria bacterium]|nr:phosphate/phosphite/phosphonate ABC transporter substrate-binding protein [Deltaproteobacteria bacterium]
MKTLCIYILTVFMVMILISGVAAEIKIGVQAPSGAERAQQDWAPLAGYLSEQLGDKVVFVPISPAAFREFCEANPQGFLFHNAWVYIRARLVKGARALVTVDYQGEGPRFGGVIFSRRDSGIGSLRDLRDKALMCYKFSSLGGWLFQKGELVKVGISPEKDCRQLLEAPDQMAVVQAVRDKKADVGTVRTGILERMQREGKIDVKEFTIINETRHEGFTQLCSTALYPEATVASLKDTPTDLAAKMKGALLSVPAGHPALKTPRVERFVEALDYGPVEDLCKMLGVEPYRKREQQ